MSSGPSRGLLVATLLALFAVLAGTAWNAIALRRLRAELDAQFQGISELSSTLSSVEAEQRAAEQARRAALPASVGLPSTVEAVGWHGRRAMLLHVEGAATNAPLRPQDKPLPQGDWFVARRAGAPSTLNPISGADGEAAILTAPVIGRLLAVDPDAPPTVVPSLATGWKVDAETLRCTYHLRRGVQFADGRPFTSADVLFSLDVIRDPAVQADRLRSTLDVVASLEAPDAFTVVAVFREPNWRAPLLLGTTLRILNRGWYEEEIRLGRIDWVFAKASSFPARRASGRSSMAFASHALGPGPTTSRERISHRLSRSIS